MASNRKQNDCESKRMSKSENSDKRARRKSTQRKFRGGSSDEKSQSGRRDRFSQFDDRTGRNARSDKLSGLNDFSWYSKYPALINTAAAFPYPYRPGMELSLGDYTGAYEKAATKTFTNTTFHVPGVLQIGWIPSLGQSTLPSDPASIVGKEMYAAVRKVYSGSLDADAPDFVMYLMALDSIFAYIGALKRIYRCLTAWSPDNFQTPDILLSSLGVNSSSAVSLRESRANLLYAINELVLQSRKFRCPAVMDLFNRHYWLNDNVYTDANTINSQFYVFKQNAYFKLNPTAEIPNDTTNTAAGLSLIVSPITASETLTVSALYDFGIQLIAALDAWDDGYTISGYLMKAFENVASFQVDELTNEETLTPLYVEEVLSQIENARMVFGQLNYGDCCVFQDPLTNAVISQPICTVSSAFAYGVNTGLPPILSVRSDVPSIEETVIASRLQTYTSQSKITPIVTGVNAEGYAVFAGTEIVENLSLYGTGTNPNYVVSLRSIFAYSTAYPDATIATLFPAYLSLTQFDWHPILWMFYMISASTGQWIPIGDVHNVTVVERAQMQQLNRVCLFSEFGSFMNQS